MPPLDNEEADVWEALERLQIQIDRRVGLTTLAYGANPGVRRDDEQPSEQDE